MNRKEGICETISAASIIDIKAAGLMEGGKWSIDTRLALFFYSLIIYVCRFPPNGLLLLMMMIPRVLLTFLLPPRKERRQDVAHVAFSINVPKVLAVKNESTISDVAFLFVFFFYPLSSAPF